MRPELQEKIFALKPEWFKDLQYGIECGDGWFDLIRDLTVKLLALEVEEPDNFLDFKVVQIKQKFGGLRYYFSGNQDNVHRRIDTLINGYETKSYATCEACGKEARVRTLGYVVTLCRYPHDQAEG
jgi:hypothetical protein